MVRLHGTKDMWLASLREEGATFRAAVAGTELDSAVPPCPGWTVAHLVHHLGSVYRYTLAHVTRGQTGQPEKSRPDFEAEPMASDLLAWWEEAFRGLVESFDMLDPDMPAWNWAPQVKTVAFWPRRMAHETAIHRWDAQMASGMAEPVEAKLAADGVAEVIDTWLPAGRRKYAFPPGAADALRGMVALQATDLEHVWHVRLRGEGIAVLDTETIFDDDEPPAGVVASGSASDLDLALWGRVGFDVLDVVGDESLLQAMRVG
jgi:uncharacterized protein (TIGR03083 family)